MSRSTITALGLAALMLAGCKKTTPEPVKDEPVTRNRPGGGGRSPLLRHGRRAQMLCESLSCSSEQLDKLREVFERVGPAMRRPGRRPTPEANAALAQAFAGDTFDVAALKAYHQQTRKEDTEARAQCRSAVVDVVTSTHEILESDQRQSFADMIRDDGLQLLSGRTRLTPAMRARKPDPSQRATRITERMCESLQCSVDQETRLVDALTKLPARNEEDPESARNALATAFAGDELSRDAVEAYLTASQTASEARDDERDPVWLDVHTVLTPQQRKTVAEDIEKRGLGAIGGGRGRLRTRRRGPDQ